MSQCLLSTSMANHRSIPQELGKGDLGYSQVTIKSEFENKQIECRKGLKSQKVWEG